MARLLVFNMVTLDGYFADSNGSMSWAHVDDAEWRTFVDGNAEGGGVLVFGRVTYELMASWWPTPAAAAADPIVARRMNDLQKVVFSRTMDKATWSNTTLVKGDMAAAIRKMKQESKTDMVIMGSGSVVSQLAPKGLIDEYQIIVFPIVLGKGRTMFEGVTEKLALKLVRTRSFRNGNVMLCYEPTA